MPWREPFSLTEVTWITDFFQGADDLAWAVHFFLIRARKPQPPEETSSWQGASNSLSLPEAVGEMSHLPCTQEAILLPVTDGGSQVTALGNLSFKASKNILALRAALCHIIP